ncbi:MAG: FkbM family methyltransferase [Vulcanimicrobiaceae bacterium]
MNETFARPTTVYLGGNRAITRTKYGAELFFDTRDLSVGIPLALNGDYEPELNPWLIGTLRQGDIAVDVGANIGFYTIHFAMRVGEGGHVFAFEANPDLVDLLQDSAEFNNVRDRCTIRHAAMADREGEVTFGKPARRLGSGSIVGIEGLRDEAFEAITVPATTLDAAFEGREPPVRLLHMDVEAAEPMVIAGGHAFIERHRDMIVVLEVLGENFRSRGDESLRAALEYLESTGRVLCLIQAAQPVRLSADQLLRLPLANVAAIPRHLAGG